MIIDDIAHDFKQFMKIVSFSLVFVIILALCGIDPAKMLYDVLLDSFLNCFEAISNVFKYAKFENLNLALKLVFLFAGLPLIFLLICCVLHFKDNENK